MEPASVPRPQGIAIHLRGRDINPLAVFDVYFVKALYTWVTVAIRRRCCSSLR